MNFDRLAPHYSQLEILFAGSLMQRCRTTFLSGTNGCHEALLVGEGTGKFLVELLRARPQIRITCLEKSAGMIRQMRNRLQRERLDCSLVEFQQMDVLHWKPPTGKFDLVVTNFFLDCFRADQLEMLMPLLAQSATHEATWLLADFRVPEQGWPRWRASAILATLYAFFKVATALSASWLTTPDRFLSDAGFALQDRREVNFGLAYADLWKRDAGNSPQKPFSDSPRSMP